MPRVSVVLSVYNGMPYLPEAVQSVLLQTLTDFEFIIINNASTDETAEYLASLCDPRIRLVQNEKLLTLSESRNRAFGLVNSPYIAVMDADDICTLNRLSLQVAFMDAHQDIWACGGQCNSFGAVAGVDRLPLTHDEITAFLLFSSPLAHPATILRVSNFIEANLQYDPSVIVAQDYDLWVRAALHHRAIFANLNESILYYRVHSSSFTTSSPAFREDRIIIFKRIFDALELSYNDSDVELHLQAIFTEKDKTVSAFKKFDNWFYKLEKASRKTKKLDSREIRKVLSRQWHHIAKETVKTAPYKMCSILTSRYFWSIPFFPEEHFVYSACRLGYRKLFY